MGIVKEKLDRTFLFPGGERWGEFDVSALEVFGINDTELQREILNAADRFGMDLKRAQVIRHPDGTNLTVRAPLKPETKLESNYISDRRHIDFSVLG